MLKNISNLGDTALYCDFGKEVNKEINQKVIHYFNTLKNKKFPGITNMAPSYNKLIVTFDLNITNFEKTKKQLENLELDEVNETKSKIIKIPMCVENNFHMDLEIAELIAEQLRSLGFKGTVNISGTGEPLLTRNLLELVKKFGERNIRIEIVTNGDKLKPKLVKDLYAAGLTQLVVSMYDGPQQKKYFFDLFKKSGIRR